jgi:hypothetical protein
LLTWISKRHPTLEVPSVSGKLWTLGPTASARLALPPFGTRRRDQV